VPARNVIGVREDLDIVEGSHGDAAVADKAFADADAVFWVTPADPRAPSVDAAFAGFTRPAAEAFRRHGVARVVGVSMLGRGTPWAAQAGFATGSLAMDDLIAASAAAYRALTNPYFMEDTARQAEPIKNQITFEAYKDRFIRLGTSDAMAQGYTDMARAKNKGLDNGVQRTAQNSTPTTFRQWCEEMLKPAVASRSSSSIVLLQNLRWCTAGG
jgi:NAD(P)H-binding